MAGDIGIDEKYTVIDKNRIRIDCAQVLPIKVRSTGLCKALACLVVLVVI